VSLHGSVKRAHVLFAVEDVSLAQVVRLRQLAAQLDPARYRVSFAAARFDPLIFAGTRFERHTLPSVSTARLERRLALGLRLYDRATLARYVCDELALLEQLEPDIVIGDLRLSLCVSAPSLGVPYAPLINAYWNPDAGRAAFPVPEHPAIDLLGLQRVEAKFQRGLPFVLRHFAAPVNSLRRQYGLSHIGDLLDVLAYGDQVLYPDLPELTPVSGLPAHHRFLGPVQWAPEVPLPELPQGPAADRPLVYVTLGSSGSRRACRVVLGALARLPVRVLFASAGRWDGGRLPENVAAATYCPGDQAARSAQLVICNGGSGTAYQALREGTPVLGLPWNMDQYLCMAAIERAGAGTLLRSGTVTAAQVATAAQRLLDDAAIQRRARELGRAMQRMDSGQRFRDWMDARVGGPVARAPQAFVS
jgi:UDP:flavonoid glycosyltransferase YjiC (YdhE family)